MAGLKGIKQTKKQNRQMFLHALQRMGRSLSFIEVCILDSKLLMLMQKNCQKSSAQLLYAIPTQFLVPNSTSMCALKLS